MYEGLLSYSGFFAAEPLYEVKPAGASATDETQQSYFVPESEIDKYQEDEIVYESDDGTGDQTRRRKRYEKGQFIYRLAGRDREKSASYYTPECLTQCVVKYSLKELLKGKSADEILKLTVCEPAMGSGAFLNEAINQLADAYLERKQKELDKEISASDYQRERQRVKAYLATHNCFGVDLNPTATELAKVSLWLNTIYQGSRCPWFGLRLAVGNSLIGARRQVFRVADLRRKNTKRNPTGWVWCPRAWRSVQSGRSDPATAFTTSSFPPKAWRRSTQTRSSRSSRKRTSHASGSGGGSSANRSTSTTWTNCSDCPTRLMISGNGSSLSDRKQRSGPTSQSRFGDSRLKGDPANKPLRIVAQERMAAELERPYTAYRRLKLVMDYWCTLWFWPIEKSHLLPTRDAFLLDLEVILKGTATGSTAGGTCWKGCILVRRSVPNTTSLYGKQGTSMSMNSVKRDDTPSWRRSPSGFGSTTGNCVLRRCSRSGEASISSSETRLGSRMEWNEGGLLSDLEPLLALRKSFRFKHRQAAPDSSSSSQTFLTIWASSVEQAGS